MTCQALTESDYNCTGQEQKWGWIVLIASIVVITDTFNIILIISEIPSCHTKLPSKVWLQGMRCQGVTKG